MTQTTVTLMNIDSNVRSGMTSVTRSRPDEITPIMATMGLGPIRVTVKASYRGSMHDNITNRSVRDA